MAPVGALAWLPRAHCGALLARPPIPLIFTRAAPLRGRADPHPTPALCARDDPLHAYVRDPRGSLPCDPRRLIGRVVSFIFETDPSW